MEDLIDDLNLMNVQEYESLAETRMKEEIQYIAFVACCAYQNGDDALAELVVSAADFPTCVTEPHKAAAFLRKNGEALLQDAIEMAMFEGSVIVNPTDGFQVGVRAMEAYLQQLSAV